MEATIVLECCTRYTAWTDDNGVLRVLCPKCHAVGRLISIEAKGLTLGED